MPGLDLDTPTMLPVLSRGKHRRPRKGACFMEFASYLAGERWSDHPRCTHPLLAAMARVVNDTISDGYRPRLATLIPLVVGLNDDDPHLDALIVRRAAVAGLPVVAAERQRVLAVAAIAAERVLAELDHRDPDDHTDITRVALAQAPDAAEWARSFSRGTSTTMRGFRRHAGPTAVRCSVIGIGQACVDDADTRLHALLERTVDDCHTWLAGQPISPRSPDPTRWEEACHLTGTSP
ncbi:hypothetical protein [Phytoactinopolyspora limicola]|uniref:hypothetical protein n=1 Tax=Phytoactinopolyspora limicola TaxID=2715536 RepID=UPI00140B6AC6|nr:hypothetical protein [Phytoactinopolyspora limicola]